jgi:hypothetical protein
MEINFSEINNINTQKLGQRYNDNKFDSNNSEKYWASENIKKEDQVKKKKVSFTDILSNMNLVVDKNGILKSMSIRPQNKEDCYEQQQYGQKQQQQQQQQYGQKQQQQYVQKQQQEQQQIDPTVKHSYIYNKYFKDYASANAPPPEKKIPKTIEEYNQMVYEERVNQIEQRKRIAEIKSTKLMFTTTPGNNVNSGNNVNPRNMQSSRNTLRKMAFG